MGYGETEAYQKGQELGSYFSRAFEVRDDPIAHRMIAKFLAYGQGYKDMDTGFAFIEGFAKGMQSEPKQLGTVHDARNEV